MRAIFTVILFSASFLNSYTTFAITLKGYLYVDKNNNGIRDKNEIGVKDVVISDQVTISRTNADGFYQLESTASLGYFFVSQPNGYLLKGSYWKSIPKETTELTTDFALVPSPVGKGFSFLHASDTHISLPTMARMQKLKHLADSLKPAFVLITGDLIKDALRVSEKEATSLYELYLAEIAKFSVPVYSVPGNHEIFGIERHKSLVSETHPLYGKKMFRSYLGPDYYSFNYGGVHFVGLNSVDYHDLWYYGHLDSTQLKWLAKDISTLSPENPVVTFNHIPLYSGGTSLDEFREEEPGSSLININGKKYYRHIVSNANEVISIMKNNSYPLALGGHHHFSQQFTYDAVGQRTRFHQTAAVIGPTTGGDLTMPSGITLYTVENGKINDGKFIPIR